ncbi:plastocyanin/azurin family copper-binding protein [Rhodocytophaga aerolata]|uniref:Plastocyanin/azurin family copper-binding protein n=1 Tax=Rhodocytophaga aerolata TaxID=455078 RepID=A0ABT8QZJ9_9BACT|nr:plastocyanin/azurin family copper-binding protein [Rhodocytophaga aerolata]MDO1445099.1 plastocyanin/azurin family copper-binding protein [Rhodocytophaga aerolata]
MKLPNQFIKAVCMACALLALDNHTSIAQVKPKVNPATGSKQPAPAPKGLEGTTAVPQTEDDFYKLISLPIPEGIVLEVGGMTTLPDGRLAICTRRGEVWLVSNPAISGNQQPTYKRYAYGLHEPLGLAYKDGDIYVTQRSEVTRLRDTDGDEVADSYDKIYSWPLSGNYHEYSYGPLFLPNGNMLVTLNLGWSNSLGHGVSLVPWRGWMLEITPDGKMTPVAAGLRSPAAFAANAEGDIFYTENQGDWVGSGRMTHLEKGDFAGNAEGLKWSSLPGSPIKLKPEDIPNTGEPMNEVAKRVSGLKPPAIWFPHGILGISTSGILLDNTKGKFGPFDGQLFVGDQGQSKIMRVAMEKVKGEYQGVVFPFREGFSSGILRLVWGNDGSMFSGMTSRGWSSTGKELFGLQRVVWTGQMPFEMKTVRAMPDGFDIEFTMPVDRTIAADPASYKITGFTYKYQAAYGSPVINNELCQVRGIAVSEDGLKARLVVDGLREGYIHEISTEGVRSSEGKPLLHNVAYYTLNHVPDGEKLNIALAAPAHVHASTSKNAASTTGTPSTKSNSTPSTASASAEGKMAKRVTEKPASWPNEGDFRITMGTKPGLKFDPAQFTVKAGSRVKVVFNNNDDMLHNFVVVLPGTALEVGELAMKLGLSGQEKNYIPQTNKVLYHTNLLQPNASESIYFIAPDKPGEYVYECSVPGHFYSMQGIMKVVK